MNNYSKKCISCGSSDLYFKPNQDEQFYVTNMTLKWLRQVVCVQCGYLHQYLENDAFEKIKQKWPALNS